MSIEASNDKIIELIKAASAAAQESDARCITLKLPVTAYMMGSTTKELNPVEITIKLQGAYR